jgi:hypothetical protein
MADSKQVRAARAALVFLGCLIGCGEATPVPAPDAAPIDVSDDVPMDRAPESAVDGGADVRADVLDASADVARDVFDASADVARDALDASVDATSDALDAARDVMAVDATTDVPASDGGYRVGEALSETLRVVGGTSMPVTGMLTSMCGADEVAVGIGVSVEGRGYVVEARVECAAIDATGRAFVDPHWADTAPPPSSNTARCPPGQHIVGILGAAGDIVDRLGAVCAPLGWASSATTTPLGPWGGMLDPVTSLCPPGAAVNRLSTAQVNYFGGTTAQAFEAGCRRISPR